VWLAAWLTHLPNAAAAQVNGASNSSSDDPAFESFFKHAQGANIVPVYERIFSDQITPVTAYRCLVSENDVEAPSFLLESVVNGDQQGRYSFVGAMPSMELLATRNKVTVLDHVSGERHPGPLWPIEPVAALAATRPQEQPSSQAASASQLAFMGQCPSTLALTPDACSRRLAARQHRAGPYGGGCAAEQDMEARARGGPA
jgi:anthranilate/para-aminobenzoate synthase component I